MQVIIPVYGIHHDPEYYPNPEIFDPDRFSVEGKKSRDSISWLPFGDGPRNCIAGRFGMIQAIVGLVILLNNFEFEIASKTPVPLIIQSDSPVLCSEGGIYLKLKPIS